MSNNTYRAPANELGEGGHTDTALAVSIAAMEQQQQQRRQQEAQRQVYNPQQQVDSSSDFARRQAYQSAQRLAPLQQGRTSQHGMTGGAPALVGPQSVPDQSSTHQRNTRSSQPRTAGYSELQVNDLNNMQHPKRTSEHRRSASSGLPPVYYDTDPTVANRNHQRSISHDAALPAIRTESDSTTDAVGHVTDSLPLPTSPLTGGGEANALQPTQSWKAGTGSHWDSEVARQMTGQHVQPLTMQTNAAASVSQPSESSAASRARLEQRLKLYGLCERKIKGDGACQFRSISDQLYRTQDYHAEVRQVAVHQLRSNFEKYAQFVPSDYWKYVYEMEQTETWGDHICLQAIADAYGLRMNIITSYPAADTCFIGITPEQQKTHRILYLSFWAEIHYQSIYPISDPPVSEKFLGSKTLARWLA